MTAVFPTWLKERELLTTIIGSASSHDTILAPWTLQYEGPILIDISGLNLLRQALTTYRGDAARLRFVLRLDSEVWRDYYALNGHGSAERFTLPLFAVRTTGQGEEEIQLKLPSLRTTISYPRALTSIEDQVLPTALLMPVAHDWDLLFANHIALAADLARRIRRSGQALIRGLLSRRRQSLIQRVALAYRSIHPSAEVHPSAVIEGSVIGPGCRVGAHAVVRFSYLGRDVRLHDGAKVEWSVVGDRTWLMHDLVLYRCHVERDCFLIHGPYQFSSFQAESSAFATILMDYRPDGCPIRVLIDGKIQHYPGKFLGSILQPRAKTLGGSLVAPGRIISPDCWLSTPEGSIHTRDLLPDAPKERPIPPQNISTK